MNRVVGCVIFVALAGLASHGQTRNQIYQWNKVVGGPTEPTHYVIDQGLNRVRIKAGFGDPTKRFKFEARTEEWQGGEWVDIGLGTINLIKIHEDVGDPGDVIVEINGDTGKPGHVYGASDVRWINLPTSQTAYSRLWWVRIAGDLGADGMSNFDRIDLVQVGGDLYSGLNSLGIIGNDITISGNQYGPIQGSSVLNVTVEGSGPHSGNITIGSTYGRNITIAGSTSGNIAIAGSYTGSVTIGADYSGLLSVARDWSGSVSIGRDLEGSIEIGRTADDDPDALIFTGSISVGRDMLHNAPNHIWIRRMSGGAISCRNMDLTRSDVGDVTHQSLYIGAWLTGDQYRTVTHTGRITANGTLRGLVAIGAISGLDIDVGRIEKASWAPLPEYSGILGANRFAPGPPPQPKSTIRVRGDFHSAQIRCILADRTWDPAPQLGGSITIDGAMLPGATIHTDTVNPPIPINAAITLAGDFGGTIRSSGAIGGNIEIRGNFGINVPPPGVSGGYVRAAQDLTSQIQILKSLFDVTGVPYQYEIEVLGNLGSAAAIVPDFDGRPKTDVWQQGAAVRVATNEYRWDTQAQPVWSTTCWKADANNDNYVNFFDIDPFVLALTNEAGYESAFRGMTGSRIYHCDMNCDQAVNDFDIDWFVVRLTDKPRWYAQYGYCEDCAGEEGGAGGQGAGAASAEEVAALYKQHVAPERLPAVVQAAANLAAYYGNAPRGQFWKDVHVALTR